jgi:hypothetical protein
MTKNEILIEKLQIDSILNSLALAHENSAKQEILLKYLDAFLKPNQLSDKAIAKFFTGPKKASIFGNQIRMEDYIDVGVGVTFYDSPDKDYSKVRGIQKVQNDRATLELYTFTDGMFVRLTEFTIIILNELAEKDE